MSVIVGSYRGFEVDLRSRGVAVVTFTNPERLNAMSSSTRRDLIEVLALAQLDDDVRVIVFTATGRGFVAGIQNREPHPEPPTLVPPIPDHERVPVDIYSRLRWHGQELPRAIRRLDKLTVAAVNGYAVQLGLSIVLACDYAVAARSAHLGSGTLRMGWQPDEGGHWLLVEHLGVKRALDFLVRKQMVDGDEAARLGLVTEAVDDEQLMPRALELATEIAEGPQVALRLLKRAVYNAAQLTFEQAGEDIATKTAISDFHRDALEGAPAFFERRSVEFNQWLEDDEKGQR